MLAWPVKDPVRKSQGKGLSQGWITLGEGLGIMESHEEETIIAFGIRFVFEMYKEDITNHKKNLLMFQKLCRV